MLFASMVGFGFFFLFIKVSSFLNCGFFFFDCVFLADDDEDDVLVYNGRKRKPLQPVM